MINLPCPSDDVLARLPDKQLVIDSVVKEFGESEVVLSEWKTHIVTYYELYGMIQRKKHYQGLASIFVPEILRAVETITANIYDMIFGAPDWMKYSGRDNDGDEAAACALTELVAFQMDENNFKSRVMDSIRQMVIAGLTVRKILWDFQQVKRTRPLFDPERKRSKASEWETVADTWTFEPVDLLTFHISDIGIPYNQVQKADWIGERYMVARQWISDRVRKGWYSEKYIHDLDKEPIATESRTAEVVDQRLSTSTFNLKDKKGKVEITERWGLCPAEWVLTQEEMEEEGLDPEDKIESVIVIANRNILLKCERNPFWHNQKPYVMCPYIPKDFQVPGMGAAQVGESLQEEINDTRNQTLDNKTMILATMWLKGRASGIRNDDLTMRPNGVITTNDMNGLEPLRPPLVTGVGTSMEGVAKNDLRESVGAASNLQGIAQQGIDTATEQTAINQASTGRLKMATQLYGELILKPTFVMVEYNNYQFYDQGKVISVIGPQGVKFRKLDPAEIAGGHKNVILRVGMDATENASVVRQQFMTMFTQLVQMQPQQIAFHWKTLDRLYGMFFAGHSLEELYPNPAPDPKDLLTPQEERDCVLQEEPVQAKPGQDHRKYVAYLTKELDEMKMALTPEQFDLMTKLIMSHHDELMKEVQAQQQAVIQQQQMAQQASSGRKGGNIVNRGTTPNASPYTAAPAPSVGNLRQGLGG